MISMAKSENSQMMVCLYGPNDILNISVDDTKMVRGITVTSTEGKLLDEYLYIKSISLLGLDAGVYFVTIHFGDGTSEVHQVIKQ